MGRLAAGEFSGARQPVAFDHAPRHREHQSEGEVGGGLGGDRRSDGDRDAPRRRRSDVDIGRRDRLRGNQAQVRIGRDHRAVDLVVQQAEQNIGLAHCAISVRFEMIRRESAKIVTRATARSRLSACSDTGWVTKMRGRALCLRGIRRATARRRRRRRPRPARRRECAAWRQ